MVRQKGISGQWQEKICPKCGVPLTKDNHIPSKMKRRNYGCKDCAKKYRQENKEKLKAYRERYRTKYKGKYKSYQREYHQEYRVEKRKKALDILGGNCVYCGCDVYEILEINHKNGRDKKGVLGQTLVRHILNGNADLSELEVTCRICNAWHYVTKLRNFPDRWTIKWE